ncbi:MAG: hypothetical protein JSS43_33810 [Proteobacteria bacterium]|nr:hypothetical protein [Pseudomonadota bacterium]
MFVSTPTTPQQIASGQAKAVFQGVTIADDPGLTDAVLIQVLDANGNPTDANGTFMPNPLIAKIGTGIYASVQLSPTVHGIDPATLTQTVDSLVFNPTPNIGSSPVNTTISLIAFSAGDPNTNVTRSLALQETPQPADAPAITGINPSQQTAAKVPVFAGVQIADNASRPADQATITVVDATGANSDSQGKFEQINDFGSGLTLNETRPGVYTIFQNGAPALLDPGTLSAAVRSLVFDATGTADTAIQLTVTDTATGLTTAAQPIILTQQPQGGSGHVGDPVVTTPPSEPPPSVNNYKIEDQTTGQTTFQPGQPYAGPVQGLTSEFVFPTTDQVTVTGQIPNVFIQVGALGQPNPTIAGINVSHANGNNVLDSYANSSFLTDGSGIDQNYVDARGLTQNAWDSVINFHAGDNVTIWGITEAGFDLNWIGDTQGAPGSTGLTGVFVPKAGGNDVGITLAGYSTADLSNGRLTVSYNTIDGTPYASIHAN